MAYSDKKWPTEWPTGIGFKWWVVMAKKIEATSAKGVASLLKAGIKGDYRAFDGLYLKVSGEGTGSWFIRFQMDDKRQRMGLGPAGIKGLSLAEARAKSIEMLSMVANGINPKEKREQEKIQAKAKSITFNQVAEDYIQAKSSEWRREKQANDWRATMNTYASPVIGNKSPAEITTDDILKILNPIWQSKHETANKVRNRIEIILNAAKARKLREGENVAAWRGHLELILPKLNKKVRHHPALDWEHVPALWRSLKRSDTQAATVLMFKLLTCVRSSEVRSAQWSEIDFNTKTWIIPADRMKVNTEHRVPLSQAAIDLLNTLPRTSSDLVFEGRIKGRPTSDMTLSMFLRRADAKKFQDDGIGWRDKHGEIIVPHGFRSTFRDWAAECTNFQNHIVEQALAHSVGSAIELAYRRGDLLDHRRKLMEAWAEYITTSKAANIVQFKQA